MSRISNYLIGILNFITFLLSILILWSGIWLHHKGTTECEKFLDKPLIILGVFLMVVSLAGLVGACCRNSLLLWIYLVVMFLLIVVMFCFTIFTFVVTNKGAGQALSNRGYKEYRLGDYSHWLQKRVSNTKNWKKINNCLVDYKVCTYFNDRYRNDTVDQFYKEHLTAFASGCCKPSNDCGFTYVGPTNWTKTATSSTNSDCAAWDNDPKTLCYNCNACKAGVLDTLKGDWKRSAVINIIVLVFLIIVYSIGCCAFRNNRRDNAYGGWKQHA